MSDLIHLYSFSQGFHSFLLVHTPNYQDACVQMFWSLSLVCNPEVCKIHQFHCPSTSCVGILCVQCCPSSCFSLFCFSFLFFCFMFCGCLKNHMQCNVVIKTQYSFNPFSTVSPEAFKHTGSFILQSYHV